MRQKCYLFFIHTKSCHGDACSITVVVSFLFLLLHVFRCGKNRNRGTLFFLLLVYKRSYKYKVGHV